MPSPKRFYATTPIYYVNDKPHIGHAYCTVLVDTMARYHRMLGYDTYLLTGTDEHGQKVQDAAERRDVTPQAHCDELHQAFRNLWPQLNIGNDDFIRTTEPRHERVVQALLGQLHDAGEIYKKDYVGWYSTTAERFWTEKDLVDGRCPETGQPVQKITETNYFFRMSKYSDALRQHIAEQPDYIRPPHRKNEVLGFLDKGLEDLCISRPKSRLAWGIELPFDRDYVTYVWFDALINYVSALGATTADDTKFHTWWPHAHHFIGKDILTTHAVYWSTMLLALDLPLPQSITATGWWLQDDTKMSKSLGNVVDPLGMKDIYGPDILRYFLMRDMVIGLDANFSEELLVRRNNSDLANDLGNLARRVAGLVGKHFDGKVPAPAPDPGAEAAAIASQAAALAEALPGYLADLKLHTAIEETMQLVRALNKFVTVTEPYRTVKTDRDAAASSLYTALEGLRHVARLLHPVMPDKMGELLTGLGVAPDAGSLAELRWGGLEPGTALQLENALFPRRDLPEKAEPNEQPQKQKKQKKKAKAKPKAPVTPSRIDFDDFMKVDLRVGTVVSAEPVEGASRLLKLRVDLGAEQRQVVAGIAEHYDPADLTGRQVAVVANLAPRKVFGVESQGMILAADAPDGGLALMAPNAPVEPGTRLR